MLINVPEWVDRPNRLRVPYYGTVVDNNDPKKLGRVKIQIDALFLGLSVSDLPWIAPVASPFLGGSLTSESFSVPEVQSELVVTFPYQDIYFGFYTGTLRSSATASAPFSINYPDRYGMKDSSGVEMYFDKSTSSASIDITAPALNMN